MTTNVQEAANSDVQKIGQLIKGIKVAMMVTSEPDHSLRARPMMTQEVEFDGTLWFFSNEFSGKNNEIRSDAEVLVSYMDADKNRYVSLSGTAELVHDKSKAAELWNPSVKAWFPKGIDDPALSLIKITVNKGEYWDGPSKTIVKLLVLAKAVQGKTYKGEGGEHKKVALT
jgi:general stress protein 26